MSGMAEQLGPQGQSPSAATPGLHEFLVTTFVDPPAKQHADPSDPASVPVVVHSEVWDADQPLGLGHPFRWLLEKTDSGVRIRKLGTSFDEVIPKPLRDIALADLYREELIDLDDAGVSGGQRVRISIRPVLDLRQIAEETAAISWRPQTMPTIALPEREGEKRFRAALGMVLGSMLVLGLLVSRIPPPQPNPQELIPPQFAKVLLTPALKQTAQNRSRAAAGKSGGENNVVQAFQSEAVKKTTKTLLNVQAAKSLLTKSTLLDKTQSQRAVKSLFEAKSGLKTVGKVDLKALDRSMSKVDLIGGKGGKKGGGSSYGSANGISVNGQGNSMVAVSGEGIGVDEGLTKDEVGRVIREHLSEVRYCYEAALVRNPGFEGKLLTGFTIRGNGQVKEARIKESSGDAGLDKCILDRLIRWKFTKPRGGVDVGVSYPFVFKSLGN